MPHATTGNITKHTHTHTHTHTHKIDDITEQYACVTPTMSGTTTTTSESDLIILQYRHSKHVGNHGDVLKHCILLQLVRESLTKNGNIHVIDTHAGIGGYRVPVDGECKDGVMRLLNLHKRQSQTTPSDEHRGLQCSALKEYLAAVMAVDEQLTVDLEDETILGYPGSPLLVYFMRNGINGSEGTILSHYAFEINRSQYSHNGTPVIGSFTRECYAAAYSDKKWPS